jgi:hypothetical protein
LPDSTLGERATAHIETCSANGIPGIVTTDEEAHHGSEEKGAKEKAEQGQEVGKDQKLKD